MRRNMKITIAAMSVLLLMAIAATIISFSFANNGDEGLVTEEDLMALAAGESETLTNIDYIIRNSNDTEVDDPEYHIVEIGSSSTPSTLEDFVSSKGFEEYVLNAHGTLGEMMAADKITYQYIQASSVTNTDSRLADVAKADLIYVSNAGGSAGYKIGNDICEELYNLLHTYAVGDYKPLIIDSPTKSGTIDPIETNKSFTDLVKDYFAKSGAQYYTYGWDASLDAEAFFKGGVGSGSMYIGINGRTARTGWDDIQSDDEDKTSKKMAHFLVVSSDGTMGPRATAVLTGATTVATSGIEYVYPGVATDSDAKKVNLDNVYDITGTPVQKYGYNQRYSYRPDFVEITNVSLADLDSASNTISLDGYDMIIIEDSCGGKQISAALYKKFIAAMYGNNHIVYSASLGTASADDTPSGDVEDFNETNYSELFYMVATDKEVARYQNIMITNKTEFDIITSSNSESTCKVIADLINASSWRGIGGPGSSSNTFTVLEIQPCYPINTALAQKKNAYYDKPSDVVNNQTMEQLGITDDDIANNAKNLSEFYDWEISPANIADALGMKASDINVVHMSSEELEANKTEILGNYDLVYIGGNISALKDALSYSSIVGLGKQGVQVLGSSGWAGQVNMSKIVDVPVYVMYSHVGDFVDLDFSFLGEAGMKLDISRPFGISPGDSSSTGSNTFAVMNGNDITYNNYENLVDYVDAGMPVVFSKEASAAFDLMHDDGYLQNSIDPDSNMAKFMSYCYAKSEDDASNILWKFDETATELVDNDGGMLGSTKTGYVEVFQDDQAEGREDIVGKTSLSNLYLNSSRRPKLSVTSRPVQYNLYDASTKLKSRDLNFKYDITGIASGYTVNLYIDDDGNSVFSDSEIMASSKTDTLSYSLGSFKGGPVYWMLEVQVPAVEGDGYVTASTTGTAYIAPESEEKEEVSILQILPSGGMGPQGANSLYFCPECQRAYKILNYNPAHDSGNRLSDAALYSGNFDDGKISSDGTYLGAYRGKHEHTFGIVKYDSNLAVTDGSGNPTSTLGRDDWDWNLADEISDTYDFHIDIITNKEYDAMADDVEKHFKGMSEEEITAEMAKCATDAIDARVEYTNYVDGDLAEAEEELRTLIQTMVDNASGYYKSEFQRLLDERVYYDFYNIWGNSYQAKYASDWCPGENFTTAYEKYARCVDKKMELRDTYMKLLRYANYTGDWLAECYDSIIIGPAENFNNEDITSSEGLAALSLYAENDGAILLFHETLSRFTDSGSFRLTNALRDYFGMDATHLEADSSLYGSDKTVTYDQIYGGNMTISPIELYAADGTRINYYNTQSLSPNVAETTYNIVVDKNPYHSSCTISSPAETGTATAGTVKLTYNLSGSDNGTEITDFTGYTAKISVSYNGSSKTYSATVTGNSFSFDIQNYQTITQTYTADNVYYIPFKAADGYNSDQYFMSNLSPKDKTDTNRFYTWADDMKQVFSSATPKYLSGVAYSDINYIASTNWNNGINPYPYSTLSWSLAGKWDNDPQSKGISGTNKASQNNSGIITTYPFTLSSELNITGTHPSSYALDVEDTDMTVWYSLGGGTSTEKGRSSLFAASPRDGKDSYFIYSKGNVFYCGAGHTKVTGKGKDNNDERRLYINIICNSVRASVRQPSINVYDYGTEENKIIVRGSSGYLYEIEEDVEYPIFTFRAIVDEEAKITNVNIYYKLDTGKSNKFVNDVDKYIVKWTGSDVKSGDFVDVGDTIANLKLDDSYFEPYGGNYTYIVIEVIDDQGNVSYQKIKIVRKAHLFDLT